jgi:pyruvate dehydrogenase E1 component alpha subunit
MPRRAIDIAANVEYLSILDEHGNLDTGLEPDIPTAVLLRLQRTMLLARKFDERLLALQRQGRIGTFPPVKGQEAAHLGAAAHLRTSDWMVPSFRELAADLWRGRSLENSIVYNNGFNEGMALPENATTFPIAVPVGSQILHAVGLAWAARYRGRDDVVMTFFGDGATSQGDFHEAMNCAAVFRVPVVFVCQNNQWAISVPLNRQTRSRTLAQKALAYGMPGIQVDGNDLLAVYVAAGEAVARARAGEGPTLIECVTYRLIMHTTADDPRRYRSAEEEHEWQQRDPLPRFQKYLLQKGVLSSQALTQIEAEVDHEIQSAVESAENRMRTPHDPLQMFDHLYAEPTPELNRQRRELGDELQAGNDREPSQPNATP